MGKTELLQIGEVGRRVGLSLRTIRYYEEMGLADPSERSSGGFRLYTEADVERLRTLKGMKPLGLALEEIRELMALFDDSAEPDALGADALERLVRGLTQYSELSGERAERLARFLAEGKKLKARIDGRLGDCRAQLERRGREGAAGTRRKQPARAQ